MEFEQGMRNWNSIQIEIRKMHWEKVQLARLPFATKAVNPRLNFESLPERTPTIPS
jgi:hypothetical protein